LSRRSNGDDYQHPGYGSGPAAGGHFTDGPDRSGRGHRVAIGLVTALLIALIGGAVAAWAYDDARGDEIAAGIEIGGVDVGGLTADQARHRLDNALIAPLRRPVHITYRQQSWTLPANELNVRGGVDRAVEQALDASRETSLPGRVWRYVSGGSVDTEFTPNLKYSKPAVTEFIKEVAAAINQDPVDASVDASSGSLVVVEAQNGVKLRDRLLTEQVEAMVTDASLPRTVRARTMVSKPAVPTSAVADSYPVYLTLDRANFELKLWENLELTKTYIVAVGQVGLDTPAGLYSIQNKVVDPAWHVPNSDWAGDLAGQVIPGGVEENPLKERWMGIYDGAGIHGTSETGSLGSAASHGCVRMAIPDVIELYDQVPVGTPIYIA